MILSQIADIEQVAGYDARVELLFEVQRGLCTRPRSLAPWMFYDRLGSGLFERITTLPEYYPVRVESGILSDFADGMVAEICSRKQSALRIVELGAGTAMKTRTLLAAALRRYAEVLYMPVDVSTDALDVACKNIGHTFPDARIEPLLANYVTSPLQLDEFGGSTLVLYLGSSIGNFSPKEARTILRNTSRQLRATDGLVLGTDLVKDEPTLVAAYDDCEGITAAFNLNILRRLNRELGANFDLDSFCHRACWNPAESRIEMHLESKRDQRVFIPVGGIEVILAKHETIHTEISDSITVGKIDAIGMRSHSLVPRYLPNRVTRTPALTWNYE